MQLSEYGCDCREDVGGVRFGEFGAVCLEVDEFGVDGERQVFVEVFDDVLVAYTDGEEALGRIDDCFEVDCVDFLRYFIVYISLQVREIGLDAA
jgi:hypothetical protein